MPDFRHFVYARYRLDGKEVCVSESVERQDVLKLKRCIIQNSTEYDEHVRLVRSTKPPKHLPQ